MVLCSHGHNVCASSTAGQHDAFGLRSQHDTETQTLKGVVERFNYSPQGSYESLLIKSGDKLVQVNFPPHMTTEVTTPVATGDPVSVVVMAEDSKGGHPVKEIQDAAKDVAK